jgi:hypothetical protein
MQVLDQAVHDGAQALVAAVRKRREYGLGDGVLVDVFHLSPPYVTSFR